MQNLIQPESTLADLSVRFAGASRVFHKHGLDFCCNGRVSLSDACEKSGLDIDQVRQELDTAIAGVSQEGNVADAPVPELVQYVLDRFHAGHREELPRLIEMARKVEAVHGDKPECPVGLTALLENVAEELEMHMQKEEQVLFPMILAGRRAMMGMPITVMEEEHRDHGRNLERLREIATDYVPPAAACNTWQALYLGLAELERELMEHIGLENNALFPRALNG